MKRGLIATAATRINAPAQVVWNALVDPELIREYMFGTEVVSDWKEGSPILWKGKWEGKTYEDKGVILKNIPMKTLELTHYSPLSGLPDKRENYHILIFSLYPEGSETRITLSQDNNRDESERIHSQKNWEMMLVNLKKTLEGQSFTSK